jgi:hypothetical protein
LDTETKEWLSRLHSVDRPVENWAGFEEYLREKYLTDQLGGLPSTPFVLLIRQKVIDRLSQLEETHRKQREKRKVMEKLLQLTPDQLKRLPERQQALVEHAKRHQVLLNASERQMERLSPHQQEILRHVQQRNQANQ